MSARRLVWIGVPTDDFEGTVAFFRDVLGIEEEMEGRGVEFIGPVHAGDAGAPWSHFRGPEGKVYEIKQVPEGGLSGQEKTARVHQETGRTRAP